MKDKTKLVNDYISSIPKPYQEPVSKIRKIFSEHLPNQFEETMQYNMITYVVPLSIYPKGYLNRKDEPLPFVSIAAQKNYISIYHMGVYSDSDIGRWVKKSYQEKTGKKIDMGKSCIRFKNIEDIPYDFIKELAEVMTVEKYIQNIEDAKK